MSERQPCNECPFNPKSKFSKYGSDWAAALRIAGYNEAHGCHKLEDKAYPNPENVCVGHKQYLERASLYNDGK